MPPEAVVAHRQWFLDIVTELPARIGETPVGAMAGGCLFDPALICETFLRRVDGLLQEPPTR